MTDYREQVKNKIYEQCEYTTYLDLCGLLNSLDVKLRIAKMALEFYGDAENYSVNLNGSVEEHVTDGKYQKIGTWARKALEEMK